MFNIAERRYLWFAISAAVIVPGLIAMIYSTVTFGSPVRPSIDFTGGSLYEIQFEDAATEVAIRKVYLDFGQDDPVIQQLGDPADNRWQIRAGDLTPEEQSALRAALEERVAPIDENASSFDTVDPSLSLIHI